MKMVAVIPSPNTKMIFTDLHFMQFEQFKLNKSFY